MATRCEEEFEQLKVEKGDFVPATVEDEVRVDRLCSELLHRFYCECVEAGHAPQLASAWARGADYFVRDFVVSIKGCSIFLEKPGIVRQFAGNWYIANTLEPNAEELKSHLSGIREFYRFLHGHQLISTLFLQALETECSDVAYYTGRIDSFWEITGDGYHGWERECSLRDD